MATRRDALILIGAGAVLFSTKMYFGHAGAAGPVTVEVLAMAHWPVQNALKPAREVLAKYDGRIRVVDMDIESPEGEKRAKSVGLKGHIPLVILVNGSKSFKRADGKTIDFVNFPAASGSPMGLNGTWTVADLEAAVRAAIGP
ncbi:hypothetical protein RA307_31495 [Xanthobacteraceae bacterium Astr-EGSB]|uniref:hypothetical protein n=1 Tax=Astrobacterium formosum TaxID=3069710 RepID=UPI0027B57AB3|nr:hypothetical protein [Xanthobacteraceae bacterium Astr-EGSB]